MKHARRIGAVLGFALAAPFAAFAAPAPAIESFTLKNGLEVIVIPNHRVPAVSHMLWFRVGAADDPPLQSGLAHYHEHLMFKGTKKFPQGRYETLISRHGGRQNAFTGYDATAYYVDIGKEQLPLTMELEADRMRGLAPNAKEALKERDVILEERRARIENSPQALLGEQMNAALYLNHPYQTPVIGWMHEMKGLTPEAALDFHRRYYHPNNAVLVVSGDITAKELKPLAEKYYGPLKPAAILPRVWRDEPPPIAPRQVTLSHPNVRQPFLARSYLASGLAYGETRDAAPLALLAQILTAERTGVLYRELVAGRKLATDANAQYDPLVRGPAEFSLSATPAEGITPEQLEAGLNETITHVLQTGVDDAALTRAKRLLIAQATFAREGLQPMAYLMGNLRVLGLDKEMYIRWPEMIEQVTAADIQEAARRTLRPERAVTGVLLPEKGAEDAR